MKTKVDAYVADVIRREAGYVNDPRDAGGETNFGITEWVARAYGYTGLMKDLPEDTATEIYLKRYWFSVRFDQVDAIFPMLAEKLLDIGVNSGQATGVKFLQRALNVLNAEGSLWPDMAVDGGIGPMTLAALKAFLVARENDGRSVLLEMIRAQQAVRYMEIAEHKASQEAFLYGWERRALA